MQARENEWILCCVLSSIPFFVVRIVYSALEGYGQPPLVARAVMATLMEAMLSGLYLLSGVFASPGQLYESKLS